MIPNKIPPLCSGGIGFRTASGPVSYTHLPDEADDAAEEAADPDSAFDPDDELPEPLPQAVIETAISAANERPTNFFMFFIIISS